MAKELGPYVVGEVPAPVTVQFFEADGSTPIDLTGYVARWTYDVDGTDTTQTATVTDDAAGEVTYTWVEADFETAGVHHGMMWVGNGTNRYASEPFVYRVDIPPVAAPDI